MKLLKFSCAHIVFINEWVFYIILIKIYKLSSRSKEEFVMFFHSGYLDFDILPYRSWSKHEIFSQYKSKQHVYTICINNERSSKQSLLPTESNQIKLRRLLHTTLRRFAI